MSRLLWWFTAITYSCKSQCATQFIMSLFCKRALRNVSFAKEPYIICIFCKRALHNVSLLQKSPQFITWLTWCTCHRCATRCTHLLLMRCPHWCLMRCTHWCLMRYTSLCLMRCTHWCPMRCTHWCLRSRKDANSSLVATISRLLKNDRSLLQKSPTKEIYILQKRRVILRSLPIVATP